MGSGGCFPGGGEGTRGRSRGRMEGDGRSSPWLLTKQLCQLAVGAAWGFVIELLEGGGGCAGGREGGKGLAPPQQLLLLPLRRARGRGGRPWGDPGKFSRRCPSEGDASAIRVCLNVGAVPRRASPARWKAVRCRGAFPSDWWYPRLPRPLSQGPAEHTPLPASPHGLSLGREERASVR